MSHLGELLSAHIDGELDGAEQDKVSVHLARCERCRAEAAELRAHKQQIGGLAVEVPGEAELSQRVLEIASLASAAGPTGPVRSRRRAVSRTPGRAGPGGPQVSRRPRLTRRRRYLMLGTVSIVMGLGTAAFTVGGSDPVPGPRIVPQVELYSEEHAITTGEVPFEGPGPAMGPEMGPAMSSATSTASSATRHP